MPKPPSTIQSRTKSRAKRLGLEVKGSYTRGQARRIRERLSIKLGGPPGQRSSGGATAPSGGATAPSGGATAPSGGKRPRLSTPFSTDGRYGQPRTNTVASGAGSQRKGEKYVVKTDGSNFYHVYGRGKKARRVRLSAPVAKKYGYTK